MAVVVGVEVEDDERETTAGHDQRVTAGVGDVTEDAAGRFAAGVAHVGESPGRPQLFHDGDWGLGHEGAHESLKTGTAGTTHVRSPRAPSPQSPAPTRLYIARASGGTEPVADEPFGGVGSLLISS